MNRLIKYSLIMILLLSFVHNTAMAQEVINEFQSRYFVGVSAKLSDKWGVSLAPEIRLDENFNADKFLVDAKLKYKVWKYVSLGATYRFNVNYRDVKATQYLSRYAFSVKLHTKIKRFKPTVKIQYTNYADYEITDSEFMRYKFSLAYNIKACKLSPNVSTEIFHQLGDNNRLYKMRYSAGMDYEINKKNYISLAYMLDYYKFEYINKHIIELGYKFEF